MAKPMTAHLKEHLDTYTKTIFGFFVYLMSDCLLFASFFATYFVLLNGTYGGPTACQIVHLPTALIQTLILLISSLIAGLMTASSYAEKKRTTLAFLGVLWILGAVFLSIMTFDLAHLVQMGIDWTKSAFLSAFFTLLGVYGMHIAIGLLWIVVLIVQIFYRGITASTMRRLSCLKLFWQFLNIVWIFIFTFVYLMGAYNG